MRILLAEDNQDNREMLTRRLERKGFEVVCAENGREAVDKVPACDPDLVLMDVSMPVLSGIEATMEIRADQKNATMPIIALTAHAMESDRKMCLAAGCDDFATKPVKFKELIEMIEKHTQK